MQQLYFVRHGQTEFNLAERVQGSIDSPLLLQSKVDAEKTGDLLKHTAIERIIASPQLRAFETATLIASKFNRPIQIEKDPLLKEMAYGKWEGERIAYLGEKHEDLFRHLRKEPHLYDPTSFGGETYQSLIERGTKSVISHAEMSPESDLLFVGHSIHLMSTILTLAGFPLKDIRSQPPLANTSVTRVIRDGSYFEIDVWNDVQHLQTHA